MLAPLPRARSPTGRSPTSAGPTTVEQENEAQAAPEPREPPLRRRLHVDRRARRRAGSASAGAVVRAADRALVLDLVRLGAEPAAAGHGVLGRGPRLHRDVRDLVRPGRRRAPPRWVVDHTSGWRSSGRACTSATPTSRAGRTGSWRPRTSGAWRRSGPGATPTAVLLLPDRRRRRAQRRTRPPSAHSVCPVIAPAASDTRKATAPRRRRRGRASRSIAWRARTWANASAGVGDRGRRRGQAGRDAVDGDPVAPERAGQRAGDPDQRGLAGDVGEQVGRRRIPHRVRDDEHDPAEAALGHPGGERLASHSADSTLTAWTRRHVARSSSASAGGRTPPRRGRARRSGRGASSTSAAARRRRGRRGRPAGRRRGRGSPPCGRRRRGRGRSRRRSRRRRR